MVSASLRFWNNVFDRKGIGGEFQLADAIFAAGLGTLDDRLLLFWGKGPISGEMPNACIRVDKFVPRISARAPSA